MFLDRLCETRKNPVQNVPKRRQLSASLQTFLNALNSAFSAVAAQRGPTLQHQQGEQMPNKTSKLNSQQRDQSQDVVVWPLS